MKMQNITRKLLAGTLAWALCLTPELFAQSSSGQAQQKPSPSVPQGGSDAATQPQQVPATQPNANGQTTQQNTAPDAADPTNAQQTQDAQGQQAPAQPAPSGTTVNPSQGPLQPVTTYPDAAGNAQSQPQQTDQNTPEAPQPRQQQKPSAPVGAATAERVPTAGGAVAKPAGAAIAPAKQHQTRSLLIKIGAIAAAGAAAGTIFALSRGTSSKPPGATGVAPQIVVFRR
jgi:hypothetical protein